ncbi:spore germination protein GerPB [Marinicrinis lubricantis]|uniref:Spore germination protein GerPB n=1 Tax=Marinicrinis lubricantis TaxID=2086470 RepID=A0ABW1IQ42_9BACL
MNLTVYQNITIHKLSVESVANSSVLQIGTAGIVKTLSNLYNTGGFTVPAPELTTPMVGSQGVESPAVPLPSISG